MVGMRSKCLKQTPQLEYISHHSATQTRVNTVRKDRQHAHVTCFEKASRDHQVWRPQVRQASRAHLQSQGRVQNQEQRKHPPKGWLFSTENLEA